MVGVVVDGVPMKNGGGGLLIFKCIGFFSFGCVKVVRWWVSWWRRVYRW